MRKERKNFMKIIGKVRKVIRKIRMILRKIEESHEVKRRKLGHFIIKIRKVMRRKIWKVMRKIKIKKPFQSY